MKHFRNIMTVFSLTVSGFMFSQVKPLDAMLSDYQYPYEVHYLNFKSQGEDLKMVYMDVRPQNRTEKRSCFSTAKTLMERTGKEQQKTFLPKDSG